MSHTILLYCKGHKLLPAFALILLLLVIVALVETTVIPLPWLNGFQFINLGSVCAFAWALTPLIIFDNEISRLEQVSPRTWRAYDSVLVLVICLLAWISAFFNTATPRFAYVVILMVSLSILLGSYLRSDTVLLLMVFVFLGQTAMWNVVEAMPIRHLFFLLDEPNLAMMMTGSVLALALALVFTPRLKAPPRK